VVANYLLMSLLVQCALYASDLAAFFAQKDHLTILAESKGNSFSHLKESFDEAKVKGPLVKGTVFRVEDIYFAYRGRNKRFSLIGKDLCYPEYGNLFEIGSGRSLRTEGEILLGENSPLARNSSLGDEVQIHLENESTTPFASFQFVGTTPVIDRDRDENGRTRDFDVYVIEVGEAKRLINEMISTSSDDGFEELYFRYVILFAFPDWSKLMGSTQAVQELLPTFYVYQPTFDYMQYHSQIRVVKAVIGVVVVFSLASVIVLAVSGSWALGLEETLAAFVSLPIFWFLVRFVADLTGRNEVAKLSHGPLFVTGCLILCCFLISVGRRSLVHG